MTEPYTPLEQLIDSAIAVGTLPYSMEDGFNCSPNEVLLAVHDLALAVHLYKTKNVPTTISNPDGSIDTLVRGPEGVKPFHLTVAEVQKADAEMWQWVLDELKGILECQTYDGMRGAVEELSERMQRA